LALCLFDCRLGLVELLLGHLVNVFGCGRSLGFGLERRGFLRLIGFVDTGFSDVNSDLILLPVYLLSYRYGEKLYRFMINGQTGKVFGKVPLSWAKIGLIAAGILALIILARFLVWWLQ